MTAVQCAVAIADGPGHATSQLGKVKASVAVADIEITEPYPGFPPPLDGEETGQVLALMRILSHSVGSIVLHVAPDGLTGGAVAGAIDAHFGPKIRSHLHADGRPSQVGQPPRCLRRRAEILSDPPLISVIVATKERPATLARCLDSLMPVEYPRVEIVVVDNDPATGETAELVAKKYAPHGVGYVCERWRGLAAAHNRGVQMASGELLAFTDDDVVVDRHWVTALAETFVVNDGVGAVTGLIRTWRTADGNAAPPRTARRVRQGIRAEYLRPGHPSSRGSEIPRGGRSVRLGRQHGLQPEVPAALRGLQPRAGYRHPCQR